MNIIKYIRETLIIDLLNIFSITGSIADLKEEAN